jgi:hypothetical protein
MSEAIDKSKGAVLRISRADGHDSAQRIEADGTRTLLWASGTREHTSISPAGHDAVSRQRSHQISMSVRPTPRRLLTVLAEEPRLSKAQDLGARAHLQDCRRSVSSTFGAPHD